MKHAIFSSSMRKHAVTNAFDYSMTYDNNGTFARALATATPRRSAGAV
jgi:GH18 family chitinase